MTRTNAQARRRLDERFERLRPLEGEQRPHRGWIRAIRDALGMSSAELGTRIGVSQQRVSQIERGELEETITLAALRRAASALDCDLVYVLQPRRSLEDTVMAQARRKAVQHLAPLAHHSRLENQTLTPNDDGAQIDEFALRFVDRKGLWSETDERS